MSILSQIIAYSPKKMDTETKARALVGEPTDEQTQFGKPIYQTPEGEKVSEKSMTLFFNGDWMNVPSIQGGKAFNEDELRLMIKQGKIQPTSVHKSKDEAEAAAKARSDSMIQEPRYMYARGQLVQPSADGSRPGYSGEYPVNISKDGNSFRVKLLNGKRKSVKDLDKAIELLKADGQTVRYLGADQKQVLNWIKSQTKPITTDDIANYIADNNLSVRRNKITSIIKDNPEYAGKVELVKEYRANFLNNDGTIKQKTVDEITKMINNPKDFPTMEAIAKKLKYKGTIKNVINQWSAQTGNDIPFERFRVHTYRDTEIAEKIIKAFDEQGDNPNIAKLARQFVNEMPGVNSIKGARNQIRRILVDYADYEPRPNEPKSANEMSYYKKRRQNIALALKRMGDTTIKDQMDEVLYNKNQEYVKLANENPNKILNDKKLRFALETTVDVDTGEFRIRNDGKGLSDNEILERAKRGDLFTEDHITEVRTAKTAPKKSGEGVKLTKGFNIEYPTNKQAVTVNFNQSFLPNAQKYLTENPNGKNVQKIVNVLNDYGLQIKVGDKTYGTAEKVAWDSKTKTSPRYNSNFNVFDSTDILPKNKNNVEQSLKKTLQNFEKHGCGKAAGGRILFSEGSPDGKITKCAQKGIARFIDDLKKGNYSKATKDILKGGGNILKNILDPKELLRLRNYFGPVALGFMAAWEGGVITDDVIRQGTPLNESLANNWLTKSFLPYTKDYAKAKNLLESGTVPSNMKKYVQDIVTFNEVLKDIEAIEGNVQSRLVDQGGYGMIDGTSVYTQQQQEKDDAAAIEKMKTISENVFDPRSAKALEMKALQDEMEATRMAKKKFSPLFGFDKLKDVRTPGYTDFDYLPTEDKDLRPITYMDAEYEDVTTLPTAERKKYENYLTKQGILQPRQSLSELKYGDSNLEDELLREYNLFQRQKKASQYPGYYGTQEKFMKGGIASLNVKK